MTKITLSVYFEGTDGKIHTNDSLTSLFYNHTVSDDESSIKMGFNGCGTNNEYSTSLDFGGLFTYGLANQVDSVVNKVKSLLTKVEDLTITINIYGFSRGGAATFLLSKELSKLPINWLNKLEINLASLEPVPGNLIKLAKADITRHSLTSGIWDLADCKINKMLVLYTNQLLPDDGNSIAKIIADAHAPILPTYPDSCAADIDVLFGCHKTAQNIEIEDDTIIFEDENTFIAFCRFKLFLEECGTRFDFTRYKYLLSNEDQVFDSDEYLIELYDQVVNNFKYADDQVIRPMHKDNEIDTSHSNNTKYLNMHHKKLSNPNMDEVNIKTDDIILRIKEYRPEKVDDCSCTIF